MRRYPALTIYRGILLVFGWIVIVGGVLYSASIANVQQYSSFNSAPISRFELSYFLPSAFISVFWGGIWIITSEIINVFVNIESRLIEIRDLDRRRMAGENAASSSSAPAPAQPKPDTSAIEQLARGQRVRFEGVVTSERVALRLQPSRESIALRAALLGQEVGVMAQNTSGTWLLVIVDGKPYWILGKGVSAEGDTSTLPIVG